MNTKSMPAAMRIVVAVVLLVAAALVWQTLPNKLQSWAPITEKGTVGERLVSSEFDVNLDQFILTEGTP